MMSSKGASQLLSANFSLKCDFYVCFVCKSRAPPPPLLRCRGLLWLEWRFSHTISKSHSLFAKSVSIALFRTPTFPPHSSVKTSLLYYIICWNSFEFSTFPFRHSHIHIKNAHKTRLMETQTSATFWRLGIVNKDRLGNSSMYVIYLQEAKTSDLPKITCHWQTWPFRFQLGWLTGFMICAAANQQGAEWHVLAHTD